MAHDRIVYGSFIWDFVAIQGLPQIPQRRLKPIKMPGVWGMAFKLMSQDASPSRLTLIGVALNEADEMDWIASMSELTGRPVSIYSSTGVAYHNQIFHEVTHKDSQSVAVGAYGNVSLGSTGRLVVFEATVQYPFGS